MSVATHSFDGKRFTLIKTGRVLGVIASQNRGRWRYRFETDGAAGKIIASGMPPSVFVKEYWFGTLLPE